MAVLASIAGISIAVGRIVPAQAPSSTQAKDQSQSQVPTPAPGLQTAEPKKSVPPIRAVRLNLVIAGLSREGCDVEVKPGNAGCNFGTLPPLHVAPDGRAKVELRDVELRGADRMCTVAITVREPGQAAKTIYRGFRLPLRPSQPKGAAAVPVFTCYLSSPSRLAGLDDSRSRK
jgi:hypothetical protein